MKILKKARVHHAFLFSLIYFLPLFFTGLSPLLTINYWTLYAAVFLSNVSIMLINDYYDRNEDAHDIKKRERNFFCSKKTFRKAKTYMLSVILVSLALATLSPAHMITVLTFDFIAVVYSHPLTKLKGKPVFDLLLHGAWLIAVFSPAYLVFRSFDLSYLGLAIAVFLYSTAVELGQEIRDLKVDSKTGITTTALILGSKKSDFSRKIFLYASALVFCATLFFRLGAFLF